MAELLVYAKNHWMDTLSPNVVEQRIETGHFSQQNYDKRYQKGDIVEVKENGFWIDHLTRSFDRTAFVVVQVTNATAEESMDYMRKWRRDVTIQKTVNDTTNHIYEYIIAIVVTGTLGYELFDTVKDRWDDRPPDISLVTKSTSGALLRLEPLKHPKVIAGKITPAERVAKVESKGKRLIRVLNRVIRKRKYNLLVDDLPQSIKNQLQSQGWVKVNKSQILNYLHNKSGD